MRNFLTKVAQFCGKFLAIVINIRLSRNHQDTFGATFEKRAAFYIRSHWYRNTETEREKRDRNKADVQIETLDTSTNKQTHSNVYQSRKSPFLKRPFVAIFYTQCKSLPIKITLWRLSHQNRDPNELYLEKAFFNK